MRGGTNVSARPEINRVGTVTERIFRIDKYCNKKYENVRNYVKKIYKNINKYKNKEARLLRL